MVRYSSTLLGRTKVAEDTVAFQLERPSGFQFKAGQYIDLPFWVLNPAAQMD